MEDSCICFVFSSLNSVAQAEQEVGEGGELRITTRSFLMERGYL